MDHDDDCYITQKPREIIQSRRQRQAEKVLQVQQEQEKTRRQTRSQTQVERANAPKEGDTFKELDRKMEENDDSFVTNACILQLQTSHVLEPDLGGEGMSKVLFAMATMKVDHSGLITQMADDDHTTRNISSQIEGAFGVGGSLRHGVMEATAEEIEKLLKNPDVYKDCANRHDEITSIGLFTEDRRTVFVEHNGFISASYNGPLRVPDVAAGRLLIHEGKYQVSNASLLGEVEEKIYLQSFGGEKIYSRDSSRVCASVCKCVQMCANVCSNLPLPLN